MLDLSPLPLPYFAADAARREQEWLAAGHEKGSAREQALRAAAFGNSPYLSRLLLMYPQVLSQMLASGPDAVFYSLLQTMREGEDGLPAVMQRLRVAKGQAALLSALADISGIWPLEQVTAALSKLAEDALTLTVDELLIQGAKRGEIALPGGETPSADSGIIVLGMGKLGGRELNYSSDIDLIIFYEPGRLNYSGRHTEQHFMNKLAHDLVTAMQERTPQGYVFRTDLRLRPDPASTPPAVTVEAAYYYYESVGQNWERAAMIKARPVAADRLAGERFLKNIAPFMWRRSLDFASINDIHSIKRQMDTIHSKAIAIPGHNVKLGQGGIREIEFYAQIHQLIWGGREPVLRTRATCETLTRLTEHGLVEPETKKLLLEAYPFYRTLEHRLQMVADEQTHSMPEDEQGIAHIATFMGFADIPAFEAKLLDYLTRVHAVYASSFKSVGGETSELGETGNLVFTGTQHDPDTLATLRGMGYTQPETVSEIVMGWHHGSRRATRTKRARELLTELMPVLLKRLSETVNPDAAFVHFDDFLKGLPAGVQLFSLFSMNPQLLGLISDIMGSAPALADHLSKYPALLDAVLYADFYESLPAVSVLKKQLREQMEDVTDTEEGLDMLRRWRNEKQFQAGVQLLKGMVGVVQVGRFLSELADITAQHTLELVTTEFERSYGRIPGGRFAVMSLGRLGSRELAFGSDIDLVFVYDAPDMEAPSDGSKAYSASVYYNRLSQRFVNALAAMGREGRLYEVDTRLRPSGTQGLLAVSTQAITHYFTEMAWTFEFMALVKGRWAMGDASLCTEMEQFRRAVLRMPRKQEQLRADASDMRKRIDQQHATSNPWDIKYVRGGLIDLDFLAQTQLLAQATQLPQLPGGSAPDVLAALAQAGALPQEAAEELTRCHLFLNYIFNMLRLCSPQLPQSGQLGAGLAKILVESSGEPDFERLAARLIQVEQTVLKHYIAFLDI